ncbi:MAG: hypothetical protein ABSG25_03230 [Bryobacteraceae bacterium]|jgi:hypothetical protein
MQSRLTPSRKRRRAARLDTDWRDAADDRCFRLDMMAELLQACGEPLEPVVLERIGLWVSQEVEALHALLDEAGKEAR